VKAEFLHAWRGYERYANGHDELKPVSRTAHDWGEHTLLVTPVDALDTMLLMGLDAEAATTREHIAANLRFDRPGSVKVFEVAIRVLGGLLSAHQMTGDKRLLTLAEDLGERLLPAFDSPTGMPYMYVDLATGARRGAESNPAEIGTLLLEFGTLAKLTGRDEFYDKAKRALVAVYERRAATGLVGERIDVETGKWTRTVSHVGGRIDSYLEYLLKCERLFGEAECGAMWRESIAAVNRHLADDVPGGLWYGEAEMTTGARTATVYGSLQAFLPGVLALGGDLDRARRLQESGFRMWTLHGVEPEELDYRAMAVTDASYELRPEVIEHDVQLPPRRDAQVPLPAVRAGGDGVRRRGAEHRGPPAAADVVRQHVDALSALRGSSRAPLRRARSEDFSLRSLQARSQRHGIPRRPASRCASESP
jgi:mannosidase alpha-like ER degradation enhancer 2